MQLNDFFVSAIRDIYGEVGTTWLQNLPTQIDKLCSKYNFEYVEPLPHLTYNFVAQVKLPENGQFAILKMAPVSDQIQTEAHWLQLMTKDVPEIYWYDPAFCAILLERLIPGYSLKTLVEQGHDDTATRVICKIIRDFQLQQETPYQFKHIRDFTPSLIKFNNAIQNKLTQKAVSLYQELTADSSKDIVLHGDLHHDNILASDQSWSVIDPHGYLGNPLFEIGAMLFNPGGDALPCDRTIEQLIDHRLRIIFEELPFDRNEIIAWTFCRTVLSAAWTFEDHKNYAEFEMTVAAAIDKVKL